VDLDGAASAPGSLQLQPGLAVLVYELLDAHAETARLMDIICAIRSPHVGRGTDVVDHPSVPAATDVAVVFSMLFA
jgi:hypothetical protein